MSANHTENYGLCQWEASDKVLRTEFNEDNAKIDAVLEELSTGLDGKASASALNALQSTVSSHTATLNRKGSCSVETFTYTGTSAVGSTDPFTIHFRQKPTAFFIFGRDLVLMGQGNQASAPYLTSNSTGTMRYSAATLSWSGGACTLKPQSGSDDVNLVGSVYYVTAFYTA